jgi:zinc protease
LNGIIDKLVAQMAAEGPSEENLAKIKEYMLKTFKDNQKENSYWLNNLVDYHCNGIDNTKDYEAIVSGITVKDVQKFANSLFKQGNKATIIMTVPEGN